VQQEIVETYPEWAAVQEFVRDLLHATRPDTKEFQFSDVAAVMEEVGERFGRWQNSLCQKIESRLVDIETAPRTGRVFLSEFYGHYLNDGDFNFAESPGYLRQLGALDESDPAVLRVIIPNYISSMSNCIISTDFHRVCCIDECEDIIGHIERELMSPNAAPKEILAAVAALPPGNQNLSVALIRRLEDVAQHHGGQVPLHGRLFAQWLHHAYPLECPYPHVSGTTSPMDVDERANGAHLAVVAEKEEMQQYIASASEKFIDQAGEGMWSMEEELIDPSAYSAVVAHDAMPVGSETTVRAARRPFVAIVLVASTLVALAAKVRSAVLKDTYPLEKECLI